MNKKEGLELGKSYLNGSVTIFLLGGFGNQLYQIFCGWALAKRYQKKVNFNTYYVQKNALTSLFRWPTYDSACNYLIGALFDGNICQKSNSALPALVGSLKYASLRALSNLSRRDKVEWFTGRNILENKAQEELERAISERTLFGRLSSISITPAYMYMIPYHSRFHIVFLSFCRELSAAVKPSFSDHFRQSYCKFNPVNSVVIHYRAKFSPWELNTTARNIGYYDSALNYLCLNFKISNIVVVTDNPDAFYARLYPALEKLDVDIEIADKLNTLQSFAVLSNCKYFIASESTFSWWAILANEGLECGVAPKALLKMRPFPECAQNLKKVISL